MNICLSYIICCEDFIYTKKSEFFEKFSRLTWVRLTPHVGPTRHIFGLGRVEDPENRNL
jgi:hypothetical protein